MQEKPSILFLQETKCNATILEKIAAKFIQTNWMVDVPSSNGNFTWSNKREGSHHIASRLDRFLILDNVTHLGGEFIASILPISGSGHWLIKLRWNGPDSNIRRPFRFEELWLTHPGFEELVSSTWLKFNPIGGTNMSRFQQKLKHLKGKIKKWNHNTFGNIFKAQASLNLGMKTIQQKFITEGCSEELTKQEQIIESQILERAKQEETLWRQKSRIKWLKDGENNTKLFHKTIVQCRMSNNITHINNEQGNRIETHKGMEEEFLRYFKKAHQESNVDIIPAINKLLQDIPKIIT